MEVGHVVRMYKGVRSRLLPGRLGKLV